MRKLIDVRGARLRVLWFRLWPSPYPMTAVDWLQGGLRVVGAAAVVWGGYELGADNWAPDMPAGGFVGRFLGLLVGLLVAMVVDAAARDQGQRVGRWQVHEHYRLQYENRKARATQTRAAQTGAKPAPVARAGASPRRPRPAPASGLPGWFSADERAAATATVEASPPAPAGVDASTLGDPAVKLLPGAETILSTIYAVVAGVPGNAGLTAAGIRTALGEWGHVLAEGLLRNSLWQVSALTRWLEHDGELFRALPVEPDGDPWPGLGDVLTRFVERSGPVGLEQTDMLTMLADRGVTIPRRLVLAATVDAEMSGRIMFDESTRRYVCSSRAVS